MLGSIGMENAAYIVFWAVLVVFTIIIEVRTYNLTTIWFSISAFVSLILAIFGVHIIIQGVVFVVLSILLLLLTKPFVRKYMKEKDNRTNVDRLIGMVGVVTLEVAPEQYGEIIVAGAHWRAVNYDGLVFSVGEKVMIDKI